MTVFMDRIAIKVFVADQWDQSILLECRCCFLFLFLFSTSFQWNLVPVIGGNMWFSNISGGPRMYLNLI